MRFYNWQRCLLFVNSYELAGIGHRNELLPGPHCVVNTTTNELFVEIHKYHFIDPVAKFYKMSETIVTHSLPW